MEKKAKKGRNTPKGEILLHEVYTTNDEVGKKNHARMKRRKRRDCRGMGAKK